MDIVTNSKICEKVASIDILGDDSKSPKRDIEYKVITSKRIYRLGELVEINFKVKNKSDKPIDFNFPSDKQFDILISDSNYRSIWHLSSHSSYISNATSFTLDKGECKYFNTTWKEMDDNNNQVPRGIYTIY